MSEQRSVYTDPVDAAQDRQEEANQSGIAAASHAMRPETHPDFDGASCVECWNDLPKERLALGRIRCVGCQTIREKQKKGY